VSGLGLAPSGISQHHAGADDAVPLAKYRGADLEGLAGDRLRRAAPAVHRRLDVKDRDSSNHAVTLPTLGVSCQPGRVLEKPGAAG
jgi:hypothetical protein